MRNYIVLLAVLLFCWSAVAATYPQNCAADGAHTEVYNTALNQWSCVSITPGGSGTVNSGTAGQIAYYAGTGTAVSGSSLLKQVTTGINVTGMLNVANAASGNPIVASTNDGGTGGAGIIYTNTNSAGLAVLQAVNDAGTRASLLVGGSTYPTTSFRNQAEFSTTNGFIILTDNGISSGGSNNIQFITGGFSNNPSLVITGGNPGAVGIGVTPTNRLDIAGGLGFTTTTATIPKNGIYSPLANTLAFTTSGAAAVTILNTGSVGIGTTTPAHLLEMPFNQSNSQLKIGSLEYQGYALNNAWMADNMYYNGAFTYRATGPASFFYFFGTEDQFRIYVSATAGTTIGSSNNAKIKFNVDGSTAMGANVTEALGVYTGAGFLYQGSTGNVGINNISPVDKLDIGGALAFTSTKALPTSPGFSNPSGSQVAVSTPFTLKAYTVSTLPSGSTGMTAYVTDALTCAFLSTLTGGGTTVCPVFYNGTAWVGY